jgi:hypothetical protein
MLGTIVRVRKTQKGSRHEQRTHQPSHRSRFERLTPESPRLCRISANLMITDPNISRVNHFDDPTGCSQIHHFIVKNALS